MVHQPVNQNDQQAAHQRHDCPEERPNEEGWASVAIQSSSVFPDSQRQHDVDDRAAQKKADHENRKDVLHRDRCAPVLAVQENRFSRRLFDTTETLLMAMAAAANIGGSITPSQ